MGKKYQESICVEEVTELGFNTPKILDEYAPWIHEKTEPKKSHPEIFNRVIVGSGILDQLCSIIYEDESDVIDDLKKMEIWDILSPELIYHNMGFRRYESDVNLKSTCDADSNLHLICIDIVSKYHMEYFVAVEQWRKVRILLDKK